LEEIDVASGFEEVARVYERQEKYEQAESLYQLVMTLHQHDLGEVHQEAAVAQEEDVSFLHRRTRDDSAHENSDTG
jgi:hypothetical protein